MKQLVTLLFACAFALVSCKNEPTTDSEVMQEPSEDFLYENSQREIKPGEMYLDVTYYPNGQVKMEGNMVDGKREGKWISFFEDGMPWSETHFEDGIMHGPTTVWFSSGVKYYEGQYEKGKRSGKWKFYNEDGSIEKEEKF
jgi:antitoxin component YwqK of YwqJK toxin-antitoxin module